MALSGSSQTTVSLPAPPHRRVTPLLFLCQSPLPSSFIGESQEGMWDDGGKRRKERVQTVQREKASGKLCEGWRLGTLFKRMMAHRAIQKAFVYYPSQTNSFSSLHAAYGILSWFCFNQKMFLGHGEMAQQLRALAVLAEGRSMFPSTHVRCL